MAIGHRRIMARRGLIAALTVYGGWFWGGWFWGQCAIPSAQAAECTHPQGNLAQAPYGDINGSGAVNVADALCGVLFLLADSWGDPLPLCLTPAFDDVGIDVDCNGSSELSDLSLVIVLALDQPLSAAIDADLDGCADGCVACADAGFSSCLIGGTCVPEGELNPVDDCASCDPSVTTHMWSVVPDFTPCGTGTMACESGVCTEQSVPPTAGFVEEPNVVSDGGGCCLNWLKNWRFQILTSGNAGTITIDGYFTATHQPCCSIPPSGTYPFTVYPPTGSPFNVSKPISGYPTNSLVTTTVPLAEGQWRVVFDFLDVRLDIDAGGAVTLVSYVDTSRGQDRSAFLNVTNTPQ